MGDRSVPLHSIGNAARLLGVPEATLRSWEERYGVVLPERSAGGQRRYSPEQLDQLQFVKARIDEGMRPAGAFELVRGQELPPWEQARLPRPGPLVLIVERNPHAARLESATLLGAGYGVDVCLDAAEAQSMATELRPDLIVIEALLAGADGAELCRRLTERQQQPVVMLSSLDVGERALGAGADVFLLKPVAPSVLLGAVAALLASKTQPS